MDILAHENLVKRRRKSKKIKTKKFKKVVEPEKVVVAEAAKVLVETDKTVTADDNEDCNILGGMFDMSDSDDDDSDDGGWEEVDSDDNE